MAVKKPSFEQAMGRLEDVCSSEGRLWHWTLRMWVGQFIAVKLFEEGAKLAGQCEELLDKAEQKVSLLLSGGEEVPFEEEGG